VGLGGVGAGDGRDDHEQKPHLRWWCLLQGTLAEGQGGKRYVAGDLECTLYKAL
jgi:hypothetical protein